MKTRIVLKSFETLSFPVLTQEIPMGATGGGNRNAQPSLIPGSMKCGETFRNRTKEFRGDSGRTQARA